MFIRRYNEIINLGFVLTRRAATSTLTQISSAEEMNINENNLPLISLRGLFVHIFNIGFHNTSLHLPLLLLQLVRFSLHPPSPDPPCNDYIDTNAIYLLIRSICTRQPKQRAHSFMIFNPWEPQYRDD